MGKIRLIKHEAVPQCGSFEVRFPDGRPSKYFYCDDVLAHQLQPYLLDSNVAGQNAQAFARAEQSKLDSLRSPA